jgi:hypothetical protein
MRSSLHFSRVKKAMVSPKKEKKKNSEFEQKQRNLQNKKLFSVGKRQANYLLPKERFLTS